MRLLRCGVDGTDKEINAAQYGTAPDGESFLVIGHENFGRVQAVGPNVHELSPGDYVVATVRRRGSSVYDQIGSYDMTINEVYFEPGVSRRHGFLTEFYEDYSGDGTAWDSFPHDRSLAEVPPLPWR